MNEMPIIKLAAEDNCAICNKVIGDGDVVYLCNTKEQRNKARGHLNTGGSLFCRNCGLKTDKNQGKDGHNVCGRDRELMTRDIEHTHHILEVKVENGKG
jgi:hypothetical protein